MARFYVLFSVLLYAAMAVFIAAAFFLTWDFFHDDTFVYLRYADHWLRGEGPVWNPGERVEGYSNFLQLAMVTLLGAFNIRLETAAFAVNAGAYLALIVFCFAFLRGERKGAALDPPALALIAGSLPLIAWVNGGLEAPLFTFLITVGTWTSARALAEGPTPGRLARAGLALACATRPDGVVFAAISAAFLGFACLRHKQMRAFAAFAASGVLTLGPYIGWRMAYYGDGLPNTFYVKATQVDAERILQGFGYVADFTATAPYSFLLLAAAVILTRARARLEGPVVYLLSAIGVYLAFVIYVGGDHAPAHRFLLPLGPSVVLAVRLCLASEASRLQSWTRAAVYVGVAALLALQLLRIPSNVTKMDDAAYYGTIVGRHIAQTWPRNALIALNTAGSTPFVARDHRFVDMLGLNDRHIAHRDNIEYRLPRQRMPGHAKGDGAYVLSREPDFVILGPAFGTTLERPWFLSDWELAHEPAFRASYALRKVHLPVPADINATGFSRARNGVLPFLYFERRTE